MKKLALALGVASLLVTSAYAAPTEQYPATASTTAVPTAAPTAAAPATAQSVAPSAAPEARAPSAAPEARAPSEAATVPQARGNQPLVRTYGNKTPTFVGTQEEVAQYRNQLAREQAQYERDPVYYDEYGNPVRAGNGYAAGGGWYYSSGNGGYYYDDRYDEYGERYHRPYHERPYHDRPYHGRPGYDRPYPDRPYHDRPYHGRPGYDRPFHGRPGYDHPHYGRPPMPGGGMPPTLPGQNQRPQPR